MVRTMFCGCGVDTAASRDGRWRLPELWGETAVLLLSRMAPGSSWGFSSASVHGQPAGVCSPAPAKAGAPEVVAGAHTGPFGPSLCSQQRSCPRACPLDSGGQHPASAWTSLPGPRRAGWQPGPRVRVWLLCSSLSVLAHLLAREVASHTLRTFPFSSSSQGYRSHSAAFFPLSSCLSLRDHSCPFRGLRPSAGVQ